MYSPCRILSCRRGFKTIAQLYEGNRAPNKTPIRFRPAASSSRTKTPSRFGIKTSERLEQTDKEVPNEQKQDQVKSTTNKEFDIERNNALRELAAQLFSSRYNPTNPTERRQDRSTSPLKPLAFESPDDTDSSHAQPRQSAHTNTNTKNVEQQGQHLFETASNILIWKSNDLTMNKSDFQRILPPVHKRLGTYSEALNHDTIDFDVVRGRDPHTLAPKDCYFLVFPSKEAAYMYFVETRGADLCGIETKFFFGSPNSFGLSQPILEEYPTIPRRNCVIIYGLPDSVSSWWIRRTFWDFEFIDNEKAAVQQLPKGNVLYGGHPYLVRFKSESEARRIVSRWSRRQVPSIGQKVHIHLLD